MKKFTGILLVATFVFGMGVTSLGATQVNRREHRQRARIRHGVRNEELTRREARRLAGEQARINRYEARARSDGKLTRHERRRLNRKLNRADRHIRRQKHDGQDRN
ncbi:MAG TPA: hypothetical protein VNH22_08590 [Blastocatellia bacterium]|nr:hypothetical protein [Blastocatellia bacterium]